MHNQNTARSHDDHEPTQAELYEHWHYLLTSGELSAADLAHLTLDDLAALDECFSCNVAERAVELDAWRERERTEAPKREKAQARKAREQAAERDPALQTELLREQALAQLEARLVFLSDREIHEAAAAYGLSADELRQRRQLEIHRRTDNGYGIG